VLEVLDSQWYVRSIAQLTLDKFMGGKEGKKAGQWHSFTWEFEQSAEARERPTATRSNAQLSC
jgi:hypothetical protein